MNRLSKEHSPYLLQHQHNPVDWYPWGNEAFERAKAENKLVLISIGYSACHWCHVMERETFENPEAAAVMNTHFINIKVDRQQRPDVDQVYMAAVHLMHQQGGWPLNCITLPDGRPIYGGTYFPKGDWMHVLEQLAALYKDTPQKVLEYAENLAGALEQHELITTPSSSERIDWTPLVKHWKTSWDMRHGGSTGAPKFPMPGNWQFALDWGRLMGDASATTFAHTAFHGMLRGGITDQIGGGMARYAVDDIWKVPHFEKMLYDNGQLLQSVARAHQHTSSPEYLRFVRWTMDWMESDLAQALGLYASAMDADSEGEEGKYYVWTEAELREVWSDDFSWARQYYSVGSDGFWEKGNYILLRSESDVAFCKRHGWSITELDTNLDRLRKKTLARRSKRVAPGLDTVAILSWNGLALSGLAAVAQAGMDSRAVPIAERVAKAIETAFDTSGYLPRETQSTTEGFLDDYAACALGLMDVYRVTQEEHLVHLASRLLERAWVQFSNPEGALCWYSSDQSLVARKQENYDNVIPAANSMMAMACYKLGTLLGEQAWMKRSKNMLGAMASEIRTPGNAYLWGALQLQMDFGKHLCVTGPGSQKMLADLQNLAPEILVSQAEDASTLPTMEGKIGSELAFYVCEHGSCNAPTHSLEELKAQLA